MIRFTSSQSITDLLVKKIAKAMISIVLILNLSLWLLAHQQIHGQTDAMVYQLAVLEEQLYQIKPTEEINEALQWVEIPSWAGVYAQKYRLILDQNCKKIEGSRLFQKITQVPKSWCQQHQKNLFTSDDGLFDLRMGIYHSQKHPTARYYLIGIDHQNIDRSTWLLMITSVSISIFLVIFIWLLIVNSVKNISQSLSDLSDICLALTSQMQSENTLNHGLKANEKKLQQMIDFPSFLDEKNSPLELIRLSMMLSELSKALSQSWIQQERFMAIAAHELKTPLTAILGELEITLRRDRSVEEYQETLRFLLQDVERLNTLTKDLLTIARLNSDQMILQKQITLLDVKSIVLEIQRFLSQQLLQYKISFHAQKLIAMIDGEEHAGQLKLNIDQNALWHILLNLIQNSIIHANGSKIEILGEFNENQLILSIIDNGKGIDPHLKDQLFAPFQRSTQVQGHGLGLYIAKAWIQKWSGDLILKESASGTSWCLSIWIKQANQSMDY